MTTKEVLTKLKEEATKSKALTDVLHMFASRTRARHVLTINGLMLRMRKEKFKYSRVDYTNALKSLAAAGVGILDTNSKGRIVGLKDIKYKIPDIGIAFFQAVESVRSYDKPSNYSLMSYSGQMDRRKQLTKVILTFMLNDRAINLPVPDDMKPDEVATLVSKLSSSHWEANK